MAERAWRVSIEGFPPITTNELTLDEVEVVERVSGVPYTLMNPLASVKVAKGLLVVMLKRSRVNSGVAAAVAEDEALRVASETTLDALRGAFSFVEGTRPPRGDEGDELPPS